MAFPVIDKVLITLAFIFQHIAISLHSSAGIYYNGFINVYKMAPSCVNFALVTLKVHLWCPFGIFKCKIYTAIMFYLLLGLLHIAS